MFKRLILDDSAALYVIIAFVTAASIYVLIAWRALRMPRAQLRRFADLPFAADQEGSSHERAH
jgi:hypothetical protein